jgi:hypothetical protein
MDHAFHIQPTGDALLPDVTLQVISGDCLVDVLVLFPLSAFKSAVLTDIRFRLPAMTSSGDALT